MLRQTRTRFPLFSLLVVLLLLLSPSLSSHVAGSNLERPVEVASASAHACSLATYEHLMVPVQMDLPQVPAAATDLSYDEGEFGFQFLSQSVGEASDDGVGSPLPGRRQRGASTPGRIDWPP